MTRPLPLTSTAIYRSSIICYNIFSARKPRCGRGTYIISEPPFLPILIPHPRHSPRQTPLERELPLDLPTNPNPTPLTISPDNLMILVMEIDLPASCDELVKSLVRRELESWDKFWGRGDSAAEWTGGLEVDGYRRKGWFGAEG